MQDKENIDTFDNTIITETMEEPLDEKNDCLYIGKSSIIGRRDEQQDAIRVDNFYSYIESGKAIAVLCDGMGGLTGGAKASRLCSSMVFDDFHNQPESFSIPVFYRNIILRADNEVKSLKDDNGESILGAGTTLVSVIVEDGHLNWASVGDSRIYIVRGNEILCITTDHNYMMLLKERVKRGEITQEMAEKNPQKEALISYIGIGGVHYVDFNARPLSLSKGDYIILCSDGLYRSLSEEEIKETVLSFEDDTQGAAYRLTLMAMNKNNKFQDNTSVVVLRYQEQW